MNYDINSDLINSGIFVSRERDIYIYHFIAITFLADYKRIARNSSSIHPGYVIPIDRLIFKSDIA